MQNPVSPVLASPQERARAVQAVLDKDGPEMDRRRELTQEVVDALAGQDLLRMLLPKSMGGQEVHLVDYAKACEALIWTIKTSLGAGYTPEIEGAWQALYDHMAAVMIEASPAP